MSADAVKAAASAEESYPPTPWALVGQMYSSIWLVPAERCSLAVVNPELTPVKVAGRVVVMLGFVDYQEGSVMTYRELFANVMVRHPSGLSGVMSDQIWVDEPRSLKGGRELWGIPKQLARFDLDHRLVGGGFSGRAWDEAGKLLFEARYGSGLGLPKRTKVSVATVQPLGGQVTTTLPSVECELRLVRADCDVPADSPLAALGVAGRRPLMSVWMKDLRTQLGPAKPVR
ncbi:acetoacetate decarboxylase family protein [Vitiosangium sp. GDMCC 1.1324]|uniref:acetoacetate decarboxylase family protein n=1 Tax=Vitiosangium sp. (strain GDMCC 1.1324) TaxID=2138576 RepID=UPI000D3D7D1E|nr:acetoacetate decarboxylase family protein [Vitiosangium sp. GDMCC 1.1324]PTL82817.1 acetoacetate decarboxylase [Vitiosangium sp. GDMCC 1.1324]